jgi:hypothetical protein
MCNLYSITTNQAAMIALFRVVNRYVGNLAAMPVTCIQEEVKYDHANWVSQGSDCRADAFNSDYRLRSDH